MNSFDDIVNFYKSNPLSDLEPDLIPLYHSIVDNVAQLTLIEYGTYKYVVSTKIVTPSSTKIDIYREIDSRIIEILYFVSLESFTKFVTTYIPWSARPRFSIIDMALSSDILYLLETYSTVTVEKHIIDGRFINNVIPGNKYYAYYHRYREKDEIPKVDLPIIKQLLELNLMENLLTHSKLLGESVIRSVSISGLSISFAFPSIEEYKRSIKEKKESLIKLLIGVPEVETEVF